jgi:predicted peptidase
MVMAMSLSMSGCPSLAVPGARAAPDPTPSPSPSPVSGPPSTLTARPLGSTAARSGFFERLPPGYGTGKRWPLLVFLHGVGENGDGQSQLPRVLAHGPLRALRDADSGTSTNASGSGGRSPSARRDSPPGPPPADGFIILSPQHRPAPVAPAVGFDCPEAEEVHAFLTFAIARYDVDPGRVYLTGLSCGAIGGWRYLGAHLGEQIAAAVLVAGDGREAWRSRGCQLARVAIWGFHGDVDPVVSPAGTIEPMTHLMACPAASVSGGAIAREQRLTVYPGVGHDSWTRTYALGGPTRDDIYAWLLRFSR